jgi:hypothetical protein
VKWCNRCDLILGGICLDSESYALLSYWLADDDIGKEVNPVIVPEKTANRGSYGWTPMVQKYPCLVVLVR